MTFSYIRDLDEIVRFIHANNLSLPAQTLPHALLLEGGHSCSQTREWEGTDSSLPSSILASVMHAMPFRAWAPFASHKLKCTWKVSRFPQTPFQREWLLGKARVFPDTYFDKHFHWKYTDVLNRSTGSSSQPPSGEFLWTTSSPQMQGPACPFTALSLEILGLRASFPFKQHFLDLPE